jgi:dTDP-4-amino-4,6-dideoxygalactose transaminase
VHCQIYYAKKYGLRPQDFPNALRSADATITLPLFPGMTDRDQARVVDALESALVKNVP